MTMKVYGPGYPYFTPNVNNNKTRLTTKTKIIINNTHISPYTLLKNQNNELKQTKSITSLVKINYNKWHCTYLRLRCVRECRAARESGRDLITFW